MTGGMITAARCLNRFSHGGTRLAVRRPRRAAPGLRRRYHGPMPERVAFIAAECEPWAKTGGLGDVVDALARALGQGAGGPPTGRSMSSCRAIASVPVPAGAGPGRPASRPGPRSHSAAPST